MPEAPPGLVERGFRYLRTPEFSRVIRYGSVSAISTVVSLGGLYLFYRVVGIGAFWANVVATTIATVPSYYLNRMWAWGRSGKSHFRREVMPFWIIAFVSLAISSGAVALAAHEAHHITHRRDVQTLLVLLANFVTYGVMWVGKYTIFNRLLFVNRDSDVVDLVPVEVAAG